ncbi:MAG: hypothetical protein J6V88_01725 [Kiritimatiellae bacterium]|jgi:hypothetical protein|nr:hypothetical protein [Kiritimatiellia bacterium]
MAHKLVSILVLFLISGLIGSIMGLKNGRGKFGFWISLVLPVIGWSIVRALPKKR